MCYYHRENEKQPPPPVKNDESMVDKVEILIDNQSRSLRDLRAHGLSREQRLSNLEERLGKAEVALQQLFMMQSTKAEPTPRPPDWDLI